MGGLLEALDGPGHGLVVPRGQQVGADSPGHQPAEPLGPAGSQVQQHRAPGRTRWRPPGRRRAAPQPRPPPGRRRRPGRAAWARCRDRAGRPRWSRARRPPADRPTRARASCARTRRKTVHEEHEPNASRRSVPRTDDRRRGGPLTAEHMGTRRTRLSKARCEPTRLGIAQDRDRPVPRTTARGRGAPPAAKQPKGVLEASVLYDGAKVGDVVRAEADFEIDGITRLVGRPAPRRS